MSEEKPVTTTIQRKVRIPDGSGKGIYANIFSISYSDNEFIIDFILDVPNQEEALLSSRVIIAPAAAQVLADALDASIMAIKKSKQELPKER